MSQPPPAPESQLPVVADGDAGRRSRARDAGSPFDAQLLGQGGARRGLKGGAPVLDQAQHAYLETEWSGLSNRRMPAGAKRRERI